MRDKCNLFSATNTATGGLQYEGRLLVDLYQELTLFSQNVLKSEVNSIVPNLFTEKEPSTIQPFVNQNCLNIIEEVNADFNDIIKKWAEARLQTLAVLGAEKETQEKYTLTDVRSLVEETFRKAYEILKQEDDKSLEQFEKKKEQVIKAGKDFKGVYAGLKMGTGILQIYSFFKS